MAKVAKTTSNQSPPSTSPQPPNSASPRPFSVLLVILKSGQNLSVHTPRPPQFVSIVFSFIIANGHLVYFKPLWRGGLKDIIYRGDEELVVENICFITI